MDDLQRIATGLATRIGRAIAIDDPQMTLITHTAHDDHVDRHRVASVMSMRAPDEVVNHAFAQGIANAEGPVRVPAVAEIDLLARVCIPVRCQGLLFGFLWIIDEDGTLTDEELEEAVEAAAAAGQVLYRERLLDDLRDTRERDLLRDVLSDDSTVRSAAAALLVEEEMLPPSPHLCVLVAQVDADSGDDVRTALDAALRRAGRRANPLTSLALSRAGGRGVLLVAGRRAPTNQELRSIAEALREELLKTLEGPVEVRVGIGQVHRGIEDAAISARRAREALEVADKVSGFGPITAWDELGVYRLLITLPLDELPLDAIPLGLRSLMESDAEGPLVETLETWLDEGCDSRATVARLQVHRTSLYYRLGRIEEITGLSLNSGAARLDLHLGLKLARLQGLLGK
jgi:DNA-binding PucR family transcriptional regulator